MKKFIDSLIEKYELSKEYQAERPQTLILGSADLSNGMTGRVTVRITPGNESDRKFMEMPESFKYSGKFPPIKQ